MKICSPRDFVLTRLAIIFVASGCSTPQTPSAPQTTFAQSATTATPAPAPDPDQIAYRNYDIAASACEKEFAFAVGSLTSRLNCNIQAQQQNVPPSWTVGQKAVLARFDKFLLQAASLVDGHSMSIQAFETYHSYAEQIEKREQSTVAQEDDLLNPGNADQFSLNYDMEQGNQQAVEADQHNIAISNLANQMQAISDDRDEYEYCAGLHSRDLQDCAPEKLAFQTDLMMYQTMASSVPQVEQQSSPSPAQTLQLQDIQDDLDAMAGGVVP